MMRFTVEEELKRRGLLPVTRPTLQDLRTDLLQRQAALAFLSKSILSNHQTLISFNSQMIRHTAQCQGGPVKSPSDTVKGGPIVPQVVRPQVSQSSSQREEQSTKVKTSVNKLKTSSRGKKEEKWLEMFQQLESYKAECGNCLVPRGFKLNPQLASWCAEQRKQYKLQQEGKHSSITQERIAILDGLSFEWSARSSSWQMHMSELQRFKARYGHCRVPMNDPKLRKLGLWIKEQRRHASLLRQGRKSNMTLERLRELQTIGFTFDTNEATFVTRLRELSEYKRKHGNCLVPTIFQENPQLSTWCHHQRRQYKKWLEGKQCHITEDRIRALNNLGFVWFPREKKSFDESSASLSSNLPSHGQQLAGLDLRPRKRRRYG